MAFHLDRLARIASWLAGSGQRLVSLRTCFSRRAILSSSAALDYVRGVDLELELERTDLVGVVACSRITIASSSRMRSFARFTSIECVFNSAARWVAWDSCSFSLLISPS
jgi:hypothetical protein